MKSGLLGRRFAVAAGGVAIFGLVTLTAACGQAEEAPEETTETTTTETTTTTTEETTTSEAPPAETPPLEPTENAPRIDPGPNPFSPSVIAPPAPTAIPGGD